jgi:hypothetical protein
MLISLLVLPIEVTNTEATVGLVPIVADPHSSIIRDILISRRARSILINLVTLVDLMGIVEASHSIEANTPSNPIPIITEALIPIINPAVVPTVDMAIVEMHIEAIQTEAMVIEVAEVHPSLTITPMLNMIHNPTTTQAMSFNAVNVMDSII